MCKQKIEVIVLFISELWILYILYIGVDVVKRS